MAMFDPIYVTEVLNDILGRRGLKLELEPKTGAELPPQRERPFGTKSCEGGGKT